MCLSGKIHGPMSDWQFAPAMDPSLVAKNVRATVVTTEPTRLLSHIDTIEHRVDEQLRGDRFGMVLFGGFAALALLLAALGIYGVMAFAVAQRRHEIGLRMALGAQPEQVLQLILTSGMKLALLGIGIGFVGVYALGRLMRSTLYGVQTVDMASFAAVSFFLLTAAVVCVLHSRPACVQGRSDGHTAIRVAHGSCRITTKDASSLVGDIYFLSIDARPSFGFGSTGDETWDLIFLGSDIARQSGGME